jgi:ferrous iron transport protein B
MTSAKPHATQTDSALLVALAGNPNAGKTSLFNRLTGASAKVGNYPGVTVEQRVGTTQQGQRTWRVSDLPGCYSLRAASPDEEVTRNALCGAYGQRPDVAIVVLDAGQLARNLLLLLQIQAIGVPVVAALNLVADAKAGGIEVDTAALSDQLCCPVVAIEAPLGIGFDALAAAVNSLPLATGEPTTPNFDRSDVEARFTRIDEFVAAATTTRRPAASRTERFDRIALHPYAGASLFIIILGLLFQGVFAWSDPAIDAVDAAGSFVAELLRAVLPTGLFTSVVVDGVWAGVVGTAVFLPQICVLFLAIEILEDSGYLARAVVLADRIMRAAGLPGRSFVPLLSSFACNVPGIMAARTIPSRSERLATIMVAPLMACSARLPIYTMVTAAVLSGSKPVLGVFSLGGLVITAMYLLGVALALAAALILRKTALKGESRPLLLELPAYRWPRPRNVLLRVWQRARVFVVHTGSVIVALTVVLWALMSFPRTDLPAAELAARTAAVAATAEESVDRRDAEASLDRARQRRQLEQSYAGAAGKLVEPALQPLGFDWRIGIGLIGSFAAREVLIPVLAQVYGRGADDSDDAKAEVGRSLVKISGMTPLVGISLMVFFAIAMQCLSTVAVIADETKSIRWPLFAVVYLNVLAYAASALVYQVGTALGFA